MKSVPISNTIQMFTPLNGFNKRQFWVSLDNLASLIGLLLAHPKTAAFVSHVGVNSLNEAVYFGVPMVVVPFFG
jgi:hypothetical protein